MSGLLDDGHIEGSKFRTCRCNIRHFLGFGGFVYIASKPGSPSLQNHSLLQLAANLRQTDSRRFPRALLFQSLERSVRDPSGVALCPRKRQGLPFKSDVYSELRQAKGNLAEVIQIAGKSVRRMRRHCAPEEAEVANGGGLFLKPCW